MHAKDFIQGASSEWLVKGVMRRGELVMVYAASGAGKTFTMLDLVFAVCLRDDWHGRKVRRGAVVYLAAEATGSARMRMQASKLGHGVGDEELAAAGLLVLQEPIQLGSEGGGYGVADFLAELEELEIRPTLVVIDTLARCAVGMEENSATEMGLVVSDVDAIRAATGATVVLVHHCGKDEGVERGSSALRAACDTVIKITKEGAVIHLTCEKQKDGVDGHLFDVELQGIELGVDEDGDPISSAFVVGRATTAAPGHSSQLAAADTEPNSCSTILAALLGDKDPAGMQRLDLVSATNLSEVTVDRNVGQLVKRGLLTKVKDGKYVRFKVAREAAETVLAQAGVGRRVASPTTTITTGSPGKPDDDGRSPQPRLDTSSPF